MVWGFGPRVSDLSFEFGAYICLGFNSKSDFTRGLSLGAGRVRFYLGLKVV